MEKDFTGKTVQEAVEKACLQFNLAPENLDYEVVQEEGKKIFGLLGGRKAIIRVRYEEKEGRDIVKDLIDSAFKDHLPAAADREEAPPTPVAAPAAKPAAPAVEAPEPPAPAPREEEKVEPPPAPAGGVQESPAATVDLDGVEKTVVEILGLMGVEHEAVELRYEGQDCHVMITETTDPPLLTSRKGQVLDALQYLVNKLHGVRGGRIFVDSGGFRSRHENNIRKLALKLGAKAKKTRRPVTINALNAHDRRIVHLVVQEDRELRSRSKGEGEFKKIIIYPKNTPRRREKSRADEAVGD